MSFGNEIKDFIKAYTAATASQSKDRYYDYLEKIAKQKAEAAGVVPKVIAEGQAGYNARKGIGGFNEAVDRTIGFEGRSVAKDNNGAKVKFGINQASNPDVDVANLTEDQARDIYKTRYWDPINGDELAKTNPALAHVAFDTAVNAGVPKARELLSGANGDPYKYLQLRQAHQDSLVASGDPKYTPYADNWRNRNDALKADVDAYTGTGGSTTAAIPMPPQRPAALPSAPQAALPLPVSEQPTQYSALDDPNQEYIYEQPEYAASGGMIGDPSEFRGLYNRAFGGVGNSAFGSGAFGGGALGNLRLPSLSANSGSAGGGVGSNYNSALPNLGRTMQALPGVSAPLGGGTSAGTSAYTNTNAGDSAGNGAGLNRLFALLGQTNSDPNSLQLEDYLNPAKLQQWFPHFAQGGYVDDNSDSSGDSSDEAQAYQALSTIDGGDDESTPFSATPAAVHGGMDFLQKAFGLTPGALQVNSAGAQAFRQGVGKTTPDEKAALDNAVDPEKRMDDSLRNMAGLDALYRHYRDTGDLDKAKKAAGSLLLAGKSTFAEFGDAALQAPTAAAAAKKVAEGVNKSIPGVKAEVDENGNYVFTDPVTGEVKEAGKWSPAKLLAAATGMKDGSLYWKTLSEFAEPEKAQSAALKKQEAHAKAIATLQTPDDEDAPATSGAPATGGTPAVPVTPAAPAIPATPAAAVGATSAATPAAVPADPRAPSKLSDLPDINPTPVTIPGGGKKLTPPAAAAMLGKPISVTAKMSPEKRQAYATLSASEQKVMQKDYENKLMTAATEKLGSNASAEKETNFTDREHVGKAVDGAWNTFLTSKTDDNLKDTDAVEKSLPKGYPGAIKSLASHLYVNNNFTPDEALEAARGLTGVQDPSSDALPFKVLKGQGAVMLPDGSTVKVPPKAVNEIVNIRKLQQAHVAAEANKKVERATSLTGRLSDAASALPGTLMEGNQAMGNTVGGAVTAAKDFLTTSERAREFLRRVGAAPPAYN